MKTDLRRFEERYSSGVDDHWLWVGGKTFWLSGTAVTPARAAWLLLVDDDAYGKYVVPKCGSQECVNPDHLMCLTKEQYNKAKSKWNARQLTAASKEDIAELLKDGMPVSEVAKLYGVSRQRIYQVFGGRLTK